MFLIIAKISSDGKVQKYNTTDTEEEAIALVDRMKTQLQYNEAFYVVHPGGSPSLWVVDKNKKTVGIDKNAEDDFLLQQSIRKREFEYKKLDGEGLDAIRKAINALANNAPLPKEYNDYVLKIDQIKADTPNVKKKDT